MTEFDRGKKTLRVLAAARIYEPGLCFRSLTVRSKGAKKKKQNPKQPPANLAGMVSAFLLLESAVPGSWGRSGAGCCRICTTASRGCAQTWLCSPTSVIAIPPPTSAGDPKMKGGKKNKRKSKVMTYFKGPPLQKHSQRTYTPKP